MLNCGVTITRLNFIDNLFILKRRARYFNILPFYIVLVISFLVFYWSRYYMHEASSSTLFLVVLFSFVTSILILILRESLVLIFLGWEGLGITSFVLIIYYQNWSRFQGGLLTLLTNRLGDGILIICFSLWIFNFFNKNLRKELTVLLRTLFLILTFTKRAQVPFTRWLPAAIAAPTPVRALVHSSTLVTAGIWLLIKFGNLRLHSNRIWLVLGLITLSLARIAAIVESDGKKIVALSTLSQLGLILRALTLGGYYICLLHLIIHAFAKANLFLVVGNLIHSRFSLQDTRLIKTSRQRSSYYLIIIIRIFSLRGGVFSSGFYSKDFILISESRWVNSFIIFIVLFLIITITLVYCVKFILILIRYSSSLTILTTRISSYLPRVFLRVLSVVLGFYFIKNIALMNISKTRGLYWMVLLISFLMLGILAQPRWAKLFVRQQLIIKRLNYVRSTFSKTISNKLTNSLLEGNYLVRALFSTLILFLSVRVLVLMSVSFVLIIIL